MKLLITGGCGFLGSNIASSYIEEGAQVVVIDALFRTGGKSNRSWLEEKAGAGQVSFHHFDLADADLVSDVFRKDGPFDYICHLGGQVAMTTSLADPRRDFETNVLGTFNVLEAMRQFSPEALLAYSSTNKVYGDLEWLNYQETETRYSVPSHPQGFDETLPLDFASPYGCSKGAADQYVRDWHRNFGLKTVVFRHSSIYGGRQYSTFDQGWIGWFCQKALEQQSAYHASKNPTSFTISGSGKQVRDVLQGSDLISLYKAAFQNQDKAAGQIFNIGGGAENALSLLELFSLLEKLLSLPEPLFYEKLPRRQSDQDFFVADTTKAQSLLSWKPCTSTEEGVRAMLEWSSNALR